jgi:hypothetical protein
VNFKDVDITVLETGELRLRFAPGFIITCEPKWFSSLLMNNEDNVCDIELVPFRKPTHIEIEQYFKLLKNNIEAIVSNPVTLGQCT